MDWSGRIDRNPKILGGRPVIRGTRVPVQVLIGSLAGGDSVEEVCEGYRVTAEDIRAALAYAAEALENAPADLVPGRRKSTG